MTSPLTAEKLKFGVVACVALICINLWSFQLLGEGTYKALEGLVYLLLIGTVVYNTSILTKRQLHFKTTTLLFLFLPLLSAIGANVYHNQYTCRCCCCV
jgi:hypothetical protein